jgi:hypothetical protein
MLLGLIGSGSGAQTYSGPMTVGSGYTAIANNEDPSGILMQSEQKIVSSIQSSVTVNWGSVLQTTPINQTDNWTMFADAIAAASGSTFDGGYSSQIIKPKMRIIY